MIHIPTDVHRQMIEHAVAGLPNEACGLLAGRGERVERFFPMRNADESRTTYRLDATEQLRVFNLIEEQGLELTGIFHTHTHSEAYPSETDRRQAYYPEARYVLVSLTHDGAPVTRAFSIVDGQVMEQEVRIG